MDTEEKSQTTASRDTVPESLLSKTKPISGSGLTAGDADVLDQPKNNLWLVVPSLGLVLFLAALDQTIVATALPTIAQELNATPAEYQWVATAYTLAMCLQGPINGRVSDILGRKPLLYSSAIIFVASSAFCGAAKSMTWLIAGRFVQGLGGGGIISQSNIIVADISPLEKRGTYQGIVGSTWGIASVLGPVLGGILSDKVSWRWCFYINLPTASIGILALIFTLKLNPVRRLTFAQFKKEFDFVGLALLMIGGALTVVGFANAANLGFDKPSAFGIIIGGVASLALAILNCLITKRNPIIPPRIFKTRTTFLFMIGSILQAFGFLPANYLLPQMFQGIRGVSALQSGLMLIPFATVVAWSTVVAGQVNTRLRIIRPVTWLGYGMAGLGYMLFYALFKYPFGLAVQEGIIVITALGCGFSISTSLLILQTAMPIKEMAATTAGWTLLRSLGASVGLAAFTAILNTQIRSRFEVIPGYGTEFEVPTNSDGYAKLHDLPEGTLKDTVLSAFADSFGVCWIIAGSVMFVALIITLPTRAYSAKRTKLDLSTSAAHVEAAAAAEEPEAKPVESAHPEAADVEILEP